MDPYKFASKISAELGENRYPPVHQWNPPYCGEIDMRIAVDGTWYYMGSPIGRPAMVKLFASVLRYDDDGHYYLVTPAEKVRIQVEDAPLVATQMEIKQHNGEQILDFRTNVDDQVIASIQHPITVKYSQPTAEPRPYVLVRNNLEALLHRNVFYQLVDIAQEMVNEQGEQHLQVQSAGVWFDLGVI